MVVMRVAFEPHFAHFNSAGGPCDHAFAIKEAMHHAMCRSA